jgi:hypothetical protein
MITQNRVLDEAKSLAKNGQEFSHLIRHLDPHEAMMLKHFVLSLPEDIASLTIYGRVAITQRESIPRGRGRPRK